MHGWKCVQPCPALRRYSPNACVYALVACADPVLPLAAASASLSQAKSISCWSCGKQIRAGQPSRPKGESTTGASNNEADLLLPVSHQQPRFHPFQLRPVVPVRDDQDETLGPTQQRERRKQAKEGLQKLLEAIDCPPAAIFAPPSPSPAELLHLSTSDRERIRSVPSLHIPSEQNDDPV